MLKAQSCYESTIIVVFAETFWIKLVYINATKKWITKNFFLNATPTLFNLPNPRKILQSKRKSLQIVTDDDAECAHSKLGHYL